MSAFNACPEVVLSKNRAKYLLTRNAGENILFKKKSILIDKAKSKEEKAFGRERERLLQRRHSIMQEISQTLQPSERVNVLKRISRTEAESDKWEVQSDTPCYTKQRRKLGICLNNSPLCSSRDSALFTETSSNQSRCTRAISEPNCSRISRSWSCVLPPISLSQRTNSARKYT